MTCPHASTKYIDDIPIVDTIEVCKDCGESRSIWEQGQSDWYNVDLVNLRKDMEKYEQKYIRKEF